MWLMSLFSFCQHQADGSTRTARQTGKASAACKKLEDYVVDSCEALGTTISLRQSRRRRRVAFADQRRTEQPQQSHHRTEAHRKQSPPSRRSSRSGVVQSLPPSRAADREAGSSLRCDQQI
ncbi:hypothetical protein HAX54_035359 [Datura stramonium]|uniref:Uncharacterized protein n=1 Tax=Datura stramonium TaxID=4076 RepID=A0ABS8VJ19_DATST|nr:hypothetical protein [Datura stramonium]